MQSGVGTQWPAGRSGFFSSGNDLEEAKLGKKRYMRQKKGEPQCLSDNMFSMVLRHDAQDRLRLRRDPEPVINTVTD